MNPMKKISVEKVTLNIGTGKDQTLLKKGVQLIEELTGIPPVKTKSTKRIAAWGIRLGLPIGCMITLRGKKAEEFLPRLLKSKDNVLKLSMFDDRGNISFGIPEYIDISDAKYIPEIGMIGLQTSITLKRKGFRIKKKRIRPSKIGKKHLIAKEDSMEFMKLKYNVKVGE